MRRLLTMTWMLAMVLMVGFGCGKGSKVNLTGLTENAPGSMSEDGTKGATPSVHVLGDEDPGLVPLANAATADGAGSAAGALNGSAADGLAGIDPNQPAAGAWQDTRDARRRRRHRRACRRASRRNGGTRRRARRGTRRRACCGTRSRTDGTRRRACHGTRR